jgi:hypothetical protein
METTGIGRSKWVESLEETKACLDLSPQDFMPSADLSADDEGVNRGCGADLAVESHNSVKSIQKQRIQRSLQKSQDGRKKLEEKLEALSNQDRLAQGHGLGGANGSGTNASNNMGCTAQEGLREKLGGFDGKSGALSTVSSSGGLLSSNQYSIRGTSSSSGMKVKDINQYKDQMLANMSKMKSLRETGEFEMSQISSAMNSIHNASISGTSEANLDTAPSHDHY